MTEQQLRQRLNVIRKSRNDKELFEKLYRQLFEDLGVSPLITRSKIEDLFDIEIRNAIIKLGINPKIEMSNGITLISYRDINDKYNLVMSVSKDGVGLYNQAKTAIKRRCISLVKDEDGTSISKIGSGFIEASTPNSSTLQVTNTIYSLTGMENVLYRTVFSLSKLSNDDRKKLADIILSPVREESFLFQQSKIKSSSGKNDLVEASPYIATEKLYRRDKKEIDKVYSYESEGNRKFFVDGYFTALDFGMGIHTLTPRYDKPVDEETFLVKRKEALKAGGVVEQQLISIAPLIYTNPELHKEIFDGVDSLKAKKLELK